MIVNLSPTVEGFIPLNQLGQSAGHPSEIYKMGDKVPAEVVEFDLEGRKIILSIAEYFKGKEDGLWKEYEAAHEVKKIPKAEKAEAPVKAADEEEKAEKKPKEKKADKENVEEETKEEEKAPE
jgi:small subunit ribosomal protein S1